MQEPYIKVKREVYDTQNEDKRLYTLTFQFHVDDGVMASFGSVKYWGRDKYFTVASQGLDVPWRPENLYLMVYGFTSPTLLLDLSQFKKWSYQQKMREYLLEILQDLNDGNKHYFHCYKYWLQCNSQ